MSLIKCPECTHDISDKAIMCPNCGLPINTTEKKERKKRTRRKLPNNFGSIKKFSGRRTRPYAAYPSTKEFTADGNSVSVKAIGYFEDWQSAYDALRDYNKNPYDIDKAGLTFSEVYELWWKSKFENSKMEFSEQTQKAYKHAYSKCTSVYKMKMNEIVKNDMQDILDNCDLGFSSVRSIKNLFCQMFRYSMENGIVEKDYSQFITINIEDNNEKGQPFTEDEIKLLWKNKSDPLVQIILILIYSGLRIKELEVTKIDLKKRCFVGGIKTKAGKERTVPIHNSIYEFVKNFNQKDFKSGTYRDKKFYKLIKSIGMPELTNGKKHTPHDCRHTFSWLCDKYIVDDVSKHMMMGHSLGSDVEKSVYGHRTFAQLQEEINKIEIPICY